MESKYTTKIYVIKNSKLLGILSQSEEGFNFTYEDNIKNSAYLVYLKRKSNDSKEIFYVFENLIPESDIVKNIKYKNHIKNEIEVLLYLDNIHGSFEFYREKEFKHLQLSKTKIFQYEDVREEVLDCNYIFPNILEDYTFTDINNNHLHPVELDELATKTTIGLSGVQYKFAISLDKERKEIRLSEQKNDLYFIKPYNKQRSTYIKRGDNSNYLPFLLVNEHIFMTIARDYGFKIPYNAIIKEGIDYHYIIKRFDNYHGLKIDHIDFLTFLGKLSSQKYDIKIEELIKRVLPVLSAQDMLILYKFLVFSVIIGHGDLHAKNLSMISKSNNINETELIISPFYDIASTKIYGKNTHNNDIGLKIASQLKAHITREDLLLLSEKMHIDINVASKTIDDFSKKFIIDFKELYVEKLPSNIKALPFYHLNGYGFDTFEVVLLKYYDNKKKEIKKYLKVNISLVDSSQLFK